MFTHPLKLLIYKSKRAIHLIRLFTSPNHEPRANIQQKRGKREWEQLNLKAVDLLSAKNHAKRIIDVYVFALPKRSSRSQSQHRNAKNEILFSNQTEQPFFHPFIDAEWLGI